MVNKIGKSLAAKTDWANSSHEGDVGNNITSNNQTGFSALPGGYRQRYGSFYNLISSSYWWSITEHDATAANIYYLHFYDEYFSQSIGLEWNGCSIRLVRD